LDLIAINTVCFIILIEVFKSLAQRTCKNC